MTAWLPPACRLSMMWTRRPRPARLPCGLRACPPPARAFRSALEQVAYSTNAALLGAGEPVARRPRGLGAFFGGR